jgi:replication-associated recombination protein RarA
MIHSHLIITQTKLDTDNFNSVLVQYFGQCFGKNPESKSKWLDILELQKLQPSFEQLESARMTKKVIVFQNLKESTDSAKEQFRQFVSSEVYRTYSEPTLLILGDLSQYSTTLQEGMLKLIEEPPTNLFIILTAQSRSEVLGTILSRCLTQNLSSQFCISNLDQELMTRVKKILPDPKNAIEIILNKGFLAVEKLSDVERYELDFWLWLLETNLNFLYQSNLEPAIAKLIQNVLKSRELNNSNCLKKLVVQNLSL